MKLNKTVTFIDVFLSSPSDVADEKTIVYTVGDEINKIWSRNKGVRLEIWDYENSRPTVDSDIQKSTESQRMFFPLVSKFVYVSDYFLSL